MCFFVLSRESSMEDTCMNNLFVFLFVYSRLNKLKI